MMTPVLASALALAVTGPSLGQTLTRETRGDIRHCFVVGSIGRKER
jgi:hypothetical protein